MVELCGPPLSFHMVPTEDAQRVLAKAPASQVGYTMAAFGRPFADSQIQGRNHRQPDLPLSRVLDLVSPTSAPFDVLSKEDHRADDLLMTDFRSVSKPSKRDHLGFEVHLIVRRLCNDAIDLFAMPGIDLQVARSSTGHALSRVVQPSVPALEAFRYREWRSARRDNPRGGRCR